VIDFAVPVAYRLEWLLGGAKWDADVLRDRVRDYVVATLGAEGGVRWSV
jgi:hypothetical protein